jgi:hypothetical protein
MIYNYKISIDAVKEVEIYEYTGNQYFYHSTITDLKYFLREYEKNIYKGNLYLKSLKRMREWLSQNYPELLI